MKRSIVVIFLCVLLWLSGSVFAGKKNISESTFKGKWPFSVSEGVLECRKLNLATGRKLPMVLFHANGKIYGVNGTASTRFEPIDKIWLDNPDIPGTKINIGPMIQEGLKLCN
jgi:hypothetical protein